MSLQLENKILAKFYLGDPYCFTKEIILLSHDIFVKLVLCCLQTIPALNTCNSLTEDPRDGVSLQKVC